jgi:hypothetical protein
MNYNRIIYYNKVKKNKYLGLYNFCQALWNRNLNKYLIEKSKIKKHIDKTHSKYW